MRSVHGVTLRDESRSEDICMQLGKKNIWVKRLKTTKASGKMY